MMKSFSTMAPFENNGWLVLSLSLSLFLIITCPPCGTSVPLLLAIRHSSDNSNDNSNHHNNPHRCCIFFLSLLFSSNPEYNSNRRNPSGNRGSTICNRSLALQNLQCFCRIDGRDSRKSTSMTRSHYNSRIPLNSNLPYCLTWLNAYE